MSITDPSIEKIKLKLAPAEANLKMRKFVTVDTTTSR
jgi:hypothetical protein